MTQRHYLLVALLNAVHVDTVKEKSVVAIRPKPAFRPIFEVATTREGSGIALINQTPRTQDEPEASESCSWWRRGRVELHRTPNTKEALAVLEIACLGVASMKHREKLKAGPSPIHWP